VEEFQPVVEEVAVSPEPIEPLPEPVEEALPVSEQADEPISEVAGLTPEEEPAPELDAMAPEPALVDEPPPVEEAAIPVEPEPTPEPPPTPKPVAVVKPTIRVARLPARPPEPEPVGIEDGDSFSGVNLNTATLEQIMTLDGATPAVTEAILAHREKNGPFKSIFDIQSIPRVGRVTFRRMTGMPYSNARRHRRGKLARLLMIPSAQLGNLPSMVAALAAKPGFAGCVISDMDGMLLAQNGADQYAESLSAVTPRFISQVKENAKLLNIGPVDSVSLCMGEHMLTTVACEKICLTAIHLRNKLTKAQLTLVRKVAVEMNWLFSHRAYIGH
jgi:competence ComEA-like helix-hairpin-helix protein